MSSITNNDDGQDDAAALFPLRKSERPTLEELADHLRRQLYRLDAPGIRNMATFLFALERLPYATPGVSISVTRTVRQGRQMDYLDASISEEEFRLSGGGYVHDPDYGGDSFSSTTFLVEASGFREGDQYELRSWLDEFMSSTGDWSFDNAGDEDVDFSEELPDDGWVRLERGPR